MEHSFASVQELNRYRKELAAKLAAAAQAQLGGAKPDGMQPA
jgi:hypothetical protein